MPGAGTALEMKAKHEAGEAVPLKVEGQVYEIQPGQVEIKKQTVKKTGRSGPGHARHQLLAAFALLLLLLC
jgi:hypothetical protein